MSELSLKQSEEFVEFYRWLYWDTSEQTGTGKLPTIFDTEEDWHRSMRRAELTRILWKTKANSNYYHRWWRKEKYVDYALSWLRLQYWPTVLDYDKTIWITELKQWQNVNVVEKKSQTTDE